MGLDVRKLGDIIGITGCIVVFISLWELLRMLWDPYDTSYRNRSKRKNALPWQIAEDLDVDSPLFLYSQLK